MKYSYKQLIASQNSEQHKTNKYTYTIYDALGRTKESGQIQTIQAPRTTAGNASQFTRHHFGYWISNTAATFDQVTITQYDTPVVGLAIEGFSQQNLRNRVSAVYYYPANKTTYTHATYYTYDVHGNVYTLVHDIPALGSQRYKQMDYTYDLVSNKVTQVVYQPGQADQFAHRYTYDADNRIRTVETSTDLVVWNREADYTYYRHGPLAQTNVGNNLQHINYTYTLQGWIKAVNDPLLRTEANPTTYADEFGYSLDYYAGDYASIHADANHIANTRVATNNLYNGNISGMTTSIAELGANKTNAMSYTYDQLNRIRTTQSHNWGLTTQAFVANNNYNETFTYDPNGNIMSLTRNAPMGGTVAQIDNFTYNYYNKAQGNSRNTNRLSSVDDDIVLSAYEDDLESGQLPQNYIYDNIGNLIYDQQEEIENISWNVSGKIVSLTRIVGSQKADLEFEYDAMGNRIVKRVIPKNTDGTKNMTTIKTTYYVRDAQSNIMASYTQTNTQEIALEEQPIYGSSRLGVYHPTTETGIVRGNRIYEGSNHLGNVLVTFSDRIVFENGDLKPATVSYSDYYAFGMPIKTRTNAARLYKFAFNGKEKDEEGMGGGGATYDYGFRIYNPQIAKFLSVDPLTMSYPWYTPYQFAGNKPIWAIDLDGLEEYIITKMPSKEQEGIIDILITYVDINNRRIDNNGNVVNGVDYYIGTHNIDGNYSYHTENFIDGNDRRIAEDEIIPFYKNHGKNNGVDGEVYPMSKRHLYGKMSNNVSYGNVQFAYGNYNTERNINGSYSLIMGIGGVKAGLFACFETNISKTSIMQENVYKETEALVLLMKNNPKTVVTIIGSASKSGSEEYNLDLSKKRVETIFKIFEEVAKNQGVDLSGRVIIKYVGESTATGQENSDNSNDRVVTAEISEIKL
ncbi:MAG TPA: RHS repeat-associated core domain-containing protein [Bacteroidales bacterium]|nr:RHS repeat-associated core domain-containing protein [Bacteroidales bacterium]